MASSVLAVGDPSRESTRRALVWCLASSALFTVFAFLTTQDKPLRAHSPWQDDPYDVVVSFTQLVVPMLAAAIAMRALRCRRNLPLPAVRVRDLLRGARVAIGAIVMTVAVDWVAVVLGVNGQAWGGLGWALIAALAFVTAAALASIAAIWGAERRARVWRRYQPSAQDPDWVEDLLAVVVEQLGRWGLAWRGATQAPGCRVLSSMGDTGCVGTELSQRLQPRSGSDSRWRWPRRQARECPPTRWWP